MLQVKPPRSAFVDFPLGHNFGKAHDIEMQTSILKDTFKVLLEATPGELIDLPYKWNEPFDWAHFEKNVREAIAEEGETVKEWIPNEGGGGHYE